MKRVLFFGAPVFQIPIIKKAKQMGLYVGVIDINPTAKAVEYADEYFCGSLRDKDATLRIAKEFKPDGIVIGACDTSVVSASYVCQQLGLPGHTIETAIKATNKLEMLLAFEKHKIFHPKFQVVEKSEVDNFCTDIPYPVITKPIDGSGSRGIYYVKDKSQLTEAIHYSSNAGLSGDVLIEEYMVGPEVSVEVLVLNGKPYVLQITDKITSGPPNFFEIGHSQPSNLPDKTKRQIRELAENATIAVGLINSPAHVEIKVTDEGPKMVELGARLGGDCISTYLLDTSIKGVCLAEDTIRIALGEALKTVAYNDSGEAVAVRFILAKKGTIKAIKGIDEALKSEEVVALQLFCEVVQSYEQTSDNASRLGFVVAKGNTTEEALATCQGAIDKIEIFYNI